MFQHQAGDQIGGARVTDRMHFAQAQRFQKTEGVLDHHRHRVVFVALGIVSETLADLVDGVNVEPLRQTVEVQTPVLGAIGGIVGAKMTAVKQYDDGAGTRFKVASADPVNFDKFFVGHPASLFLT